MTNGFATDNFATFGGGRFEDKRCIGTRCVRVWGKWCELGLEHDVQEHLDRENAVGHFVRLVAQMSFGGFHDQVPVLRFTETFKDINVTIEVAMKSGIVACHCWDATFVFYFGQNGGRRTIGVGPRGDLAGD